MKRIAVRLAVLAVVIVLGLITIAQAQRYAESKANKETAKTAAVKPKPAAPKPIPLAVEDDAPAAESVDPFSARGAEPRRLNEPALARRAVAAKQPAQQPRRLNPAQEETARPMPDPFGLGQHVETESGFVEQTAAELPADEDAVEPAETPAEPRTTARLREAAPPKTVDRYGRPLAQAPPAQLAVEDAAPLNAVDASDANFNPPAGHEPAARGEGTGTPGAAQLEGPQAPHLTIEKTAPKEIQVGKPAVFTIKLRNAGQVAAHGVQIHDEIPRGTQLVSTNPRATQDAQGMLVWDLTTVKPGDEVTAQVELMPLTEGEIGSLATVHFRAEASVRTLATRPQLALEIKSPQKVMIGDDVLLKIKISNPGTGIATGVVITETIPQGLKHSSGAELEFEVGQLKPGERRELDLALSATQAGRVVNTLVARGDANLKAEDHAELEVIAPELKVGMTGPKKRFLERSATYNISVSNPGTAAAKDIELVTKLPKGLKFVQANNAGHYDAATHSVYWSLEELPPQQSGNVSLTALPIEAGELKMQIKGQAKQGLTDQQEETITVEGIAALQFTLTDVSDPVEVGGETTYEIRVTNQGSKAATNVKLVAVLPPEMKPVSAEGPVRHTVDGQRVLFDALKTLAPKADTSYSVKVQALQPGDLRVRVQIVTDEIRTPVTKEESTRVYADE